MPSLISRQQFMSSGTRCRACSTAERTATNMVIAPIARVHRAPHAPRSSHLCSCSLRSRSSHLCSPLLTRAPCSPCSSCSCSLHSCSLLLTRAPCSPCSSCLCSLHSQLPFRLWRCSRTFPSTTCARYSVFRLCFSALSLAPWTLLLLV